MTRLDAAWAALLVGACMWLYAPMLSFSFLSLDDPGYVTDNAVVRSGLSWRTFMNALTDFVEGHWHPLTVLSHALDVQLFGMDAGAHHRTSLVLVGVLTAAIFFALRMLGLRQMTSVFATALIVMHPLRIESFAWISTRKDLLSGVFFFASLIAYAFFTRSRTVLRMLLVMALFALALLSKPTTTILPLVCLALDAWPLERVQLPTSWSSLRAWIPRIVEKLPLFALSAASVTMTFISQRSAGAVQEGGEHSLGKHIANAGVSYLTYVGRFIWPLPISVFHPYEVVRPGLGLAAWLVIIGITVAVLRNARWPLGARVGWLYYVGAFAPTIGFVQVGGQSMADRWLLLPGIGLVFVVISVGDVALARVVEGVRIALGVVLCTALFLMTRHELPVFHDNVALYERALDVAPNFFCHNNLGVTLEEQGKLDEAERHYREAVRLHPTYPLALGNMGNALARRGQYTEAAEMYTRALARDPSFGNARMAFSLMRTQQATALLNARDGAAAAPLLVQAIELNPGNADAFAQLGQAQLLLGHAPQARASFERALQLQPQHAFAREMLSRLQR